MVGEVVEFCELSKTSDGGSSGRHCGGYAEDSRRGEGLLYLRREAWIGFCWQAEDVLELFGLSIEAIEDCGARISSLCMQCQDL